MRVFPFRFVDESFACLLSDLEQFRLSAIQIKEEASVRARLARCGGAKAIRLLAASHSDGVYREAYKLSRGGLRVEELNTYINQIGELRRNRCATVNGALSGDARILAIASIDIALASAVIARLSELISRTRHQAFMKAVCAACSVLEEAA